MVEYSTPRNRGVGETAEPLTSSGSRLCLEADSAKNDVFDDDVDVIDDGAAASERHTDHLQSPSSRSDDLVVVNTSEQNDEHVQVPLSCANKVVVAEDLVKRRRRQGLLVFAFLYTFFFSGAFFGWGPMQLLLEENGSYKSKCTEEEQAKGEVCPSQSAALVRIHFTATVTQIISPLLGELLDRYGPTFISYPMGVCGCLGVSLLVVAAQMQEDWLLFASFIAIANATWMGALLTVQTGMVFQGRMRARVIFVINALFDAGSITYLGLWGLANAFDWSLTVVASLYLVLALFCFGGAAYFWTVVEPESEEPLHDPTNALDTNESVLRRGSEESNKLDGPKAKEVAANSIEERSGQREYNVESAQNIGQEHHEAESTYVLVAERTSRQQLLSRPFLMALLFATIMVTANQWTLTTTRDFLASLGDDEVGNKYLTIFTLLFPASLCALPFTDAITAKYGFYGGFLAINILALGYSLIRLLSDNLNVQVLGFILFSFFRSLLFGVTFSALPVLLSPDVVGKATGFTYALSGLTTYVNIPLSRYAIEKQENFFIPNLIYTVLIAPCTWASWELARAIDKEEEIRQQRRKHDAAN